TAIRGRRKIADLVIRLGLVAKPSGDIPDQRSQNGGLGCEATARQARALDGRRGAKRVVARRPTIRAASPYGRSPSRQGAPGRHRRASALSAPVPAPASAP